jgi:hypothetical protein
MQVRAMALIQREIGVEIRARQVQAALHFHEIVSARFLLDRQAIATKGIRPIAPYPKLLSGVAENALSREIVDIA